MTTIKLDVKHSAPAVLLLFVTLLSQIVSSQTSSTPAKPVPSSSSIAIELPVIMRQNVIAGKTPTGTKVQAKLTVATMVNGVVIPQDAILFGEVTESAAKSATELSRLALRMDSAQWKIGSAPSELALVPKLYLTAWYYPVVLATNQDLSSGLPDADRNSRVATGAGIYPGQRNPGSPPLQGPDAPSGRNTPPASTTDISQHRVLMKNVESTRNSDGAVTLTSKHSNIKLDKSTTYVFSSGNLSAGPG